MSVKPREVGTEADLWAVVDRFQAQRSKLFYSEAFTPQALATALETFKGLSQEQLALVLSGELGVAAPAGTGPGFWFDLLAAMAIPADSAWHTLALAGSSQMYGATGLFTPALNGIALTAHAFVHVTVQAEINDSTQTGKLLALEIDKTSSGQGVLVRGQTAFVQGYATAVYDGALLAGHIVRATSQMDVSAVIADTGYLTVNATAV